MVLLAAVAAVMVAAHAGALGPLQCAEEERLLDERKRNGAKRLSKIPPQPLKKKRVRAADVGAAARVAKMRQRRLDEGVTMRGGPRQKQSKKSRMVDSNRKPDADGLFATKKDVPPMRDPYFGLQIPLIRQDMLTYLMNYSISILKILKILNIIFSKKKKVFLRIIMIHVCTLEYV